MLGRAGSMGSFGSIGTEGSVREGVGCGAYLWGSGPLPIGLDVSSDDPPAGKKARPPCARAGEEEPGAEGSGWRPLCILGSISPRHGGVGEKVDDGGCGSKSIH